MQLRYVNAKGQRVIVQLGTNPLTIGRSPEADIVLDAPNVSRFHCALRRWDEDYIIKDLRSENGTFVNGRRIDVARLYPGDKITVGTHNLFFEKRTRVSEGPGTIIKKIGLEMEESQKGYSTMLIQLVKEAERR